MLDPAGLEASALGILPISHGRLECRPELVVPLGVVPLRREEFEDRVKVARSVVHGWVGLVEVLPSPAPDRRLHGPIDHYRRVKGEVKLLALVGGEVGGVGHRPPDPLQRTDEGCRRAVDHRPRPLGIRGAFPREIYACLEVMVWEPIVPDGLGPVVDDIHMGGEGRIRPAFFGAVGHHHRDLQLLASESAFGSRRRIHRSPLGE